MLYRDTSFKERQVFTVIFILWEDMAYIMACPLEDHMLSVNMCYGCTQYRLMIRLSVIRGHLFFGWYILC